MAKKKNPHSGRGLDEFIVEQRAKDPEFRAEFDRLQPARKVKGLREKKKMSQVKLTALAGTKQPNIARLESGKVVPRLDFLEKVARGLGGRLETSASLKGSERVMDQPPHPRTRAHRWPEPPSPRAGCRRRWNGAAS